MNKHSLTFYFGIIFGTSVQGIFNGIGYEPIFNPAVPVFAYLITAGISIILTVLVSVRE